MIKDREVTHMQQHSVDSEDADSAFAIKCRFIQSYFNHGWAKRFERTGNQSSSENARVWQQQDMGGRMWEGLFLELGFPKLSYSGNGTNDELQVRRNVLGGLVRVLAAEHIGMAGREIRMVEIEAGGGDRFFDIKVRAGVKAHLEYHAEDGHVHLHWDEPARFEFSSGLEDVENLLEEQYSRVKKMVLHKLDAPVNAYLHNVRINLQALPDNNAQYMLIGVLYSASSTKVPQTYPLSAAYNVNLGFNEKYFTGLTLGLAPADKNWVLGLFLPPGSWVMSGRPEKYETTFHRCSYSSNSLSGVNESRASAAVWRLNPASQIFATGARRILLTLSPAAASAQWALEGEALGTLEKEGADYYYTPPVKINPTAHYNEGTELQVAPAYRTSVSNPVGVDKIKVTVGNDVAYSTLVTNKVFPTHLIRVATSGAQLKLTLWYYSNREGKELQVPANDITWRVVAGDGVVSEEGVLTPGVDPCSTVVGIDERYPDEWRWGITILPFPLIGAEYVASFIQGEAKS